MKQEKLFGNVLKFPWVCNDLCDRYTLGTKFGEYRVLNSDLWGGWIAYCGDNLIVNIGVGIKFPSEKAALVVAEQDYITKKNTLTGVRPGFVAIPITTAEFMLDMLYGKVDKVNKGQGAGFPPGYRLRLDEAQMTLAAVLSEYARKKQGA